MEAAPVWDDVTRLFWCETKVNAYDLPDGREWQLEFKEIMKNCSPTVTTKRSTRQLGRHVSDAPTPSMAGRPGRRLARFPSDPDKRTARAAHTAALMKMPQKAGVQAIIQGRLLAFFRFEGQVFAVDALCPHQAGNLCEGEIGDIEDMVDGTSCYIVCPVHKMQFDLASGKVMEGDCPELPVYAVRIREADERQKIAMIEVGFKSLAAAYFGCGDRVEEPDF